MTTAPPRHVAVLIPSLAGGGAERAMLLFAAGLVEIGCRVDLILGCRRGVLQTLVPPGVRVFDLKKERMILALLPLVRYLREERPPVLYATITHANVLAVLAAKIAAVPTKVILRESNTPLSVPAPTISARTVRALLPRIYPMAHAVISVSDAVAQDLTALSPKLRGKIKVLPNPVVSSEMYALALEMPGHPWLEGEAVPYVLAAGRLHPQKDFSALLEAFSLVRRARDLKLIIIGEGMERKRLEAQAESLGLTASVSMPGFVSNPFPYLKRAAAFVLSSRYEGMPNVVIQALALCTPVVATDCPGGHVELLRENRLGFIVPVGDTQRMSEAILAAAASPRDPHTSALIADRFGVDRSVLAYLAAGA